MPEQSGGGMTGALNLLVFVSAKMAWLVTAPLRFVVNDRHLGAAFRQGLHELGNTFGQMLPDSNTVNEVGNIWSPTQGEIASGGKASKQFYGMDHTVHSPGNRPLLPSEIARSNRPYDPGQAKGKEHGLEP